VPRQIGNKAHLSLEEHRMTMTVTPQQTTDEIQVIRKPPSIAEAQLIVAMATNDSVSGADRGYAVLRAFETPPTLGQLRKKHPVGSEPYRHALGFLASSEMTATFVKQGLLSEDLVNDLYWVAGAWQVTEKVCKGLRRETGAPRLYENFELLASRAT
jgi:hypothetical protein